MVHKFYVFSLFRIWMMIQGRVLVQVLQKLNRPILYSVSPGVIPTPVMEKDISGLVNMYRVTGDD